MAKITAYLTKNIHGNIELWKSKPVYDKKYGTFCAGNYDEVGTEITENNFLDSLIKNRECIEIRITRVKSIYDYSKSPEGKLMEVIFDKLKEGIFKN